MLLIRGGSTHREVAAATGIPQPTLRNWVHGRVPKRALRPATCEHCRAAVHTFAAAPKPASAYLLGIYLGDGYLCQVSRTQSLRVALDSAYPGIIEEVAAAIEKVRGRRP